MNIEKRGEGITEESAEAAAAETAAPAPSPAAGGEHKPVLKYLMILFAIAFALILFSFVMHQRSNAEVLQELQSQVETLQKLQEIEQDYSNLLEENASLKSQAETLGEQVETLREDLSAEGSKNRAMTLLWKLESLYRNGDREACAAVLEELKEDELYLSLPELWQDTTLQAETPRAAYERISAALAK